MAEPELLTVGRRMGRVLGLAVVAAALCVMLYHQVRWLVPLHHHNVVTFRAYDQGFEMDSFESSLGRMDLGATWGPRVLSNVAGSLATRECCAGRELSLPNLGQMLHGEDFPHDAGLYGVFWLALIFGLYLLAFGGEALIPILGTYCGVAFGYMPGIADRIYPWDMPSLFFFSAFLVCLVRGRLLVFLPLLPVAVLFKETAIVLALAYAFVPGSLRRRAMFTAVALGLCVAARWVGVEISGSEVSTPDLLPRLAANLRFVFGFELPSEDWYHPAVMVPHPLLIDAGLLVAFVLHPPRGPHRAALWTVVGAFTAAAFASGVVFEYRIWFELIPILLYPWYADRLAPRVASSS
ncbi:hypothetical protein MK489_21585 [Myxococcota bacterium]|nr:hypothetical protein [Myxococcota bacterium]